MPYVRLGVTEELVAFGNQQKWPWPKDPNSLVGQKYKVAQCFVWHLNSEGKIRLMKQYLIPAASGLSSNEMVCNSSDLWPRAGSDDPPLAHQGILVPLELMNGSLSRSPSEN